MLDAYQLVINFNLGLTGLAFPSFAFFIGDVVNSFDPTMNKNEALDVITNITYIVFIIGICVWITSAVN